MSTQLKYLRLGVMAIPIVALLLFGLATPAAADKPFREYTPTSPFILPYSPCGSFEVLLTPLTDKVKATTFFDKEGNPRFQILSGKLKVQLTNVNTDKSVDRNISGPIKIEFQSDGSVRVTTKGPTLFTFEPDEGSGFPKLALFYGLTVSEFDAAGEFEFLSATGKVEDLCAALSQ